MGGDGEVAAVRRARDAAGVTSSACHSAQRHEPRASAAGADARPRRVRDVAAEGRPRAGVFGGARVAWVRHGGPQPVVCVRALAVCAARALRATRRCAWNRYQSINECDGTVGAVGGDDYPVRA